MCFSCSVALIFFHVVNTQKGNITAMLCVKYDNEYTTEK